jgi:hypothetical protein
MKIANLYRPFILECDCSDFALGALLSQVCDTHNKLHPIAYLSRSLIQSEKNYKIFDKELLAIVAAYKEWPQYLEGNPHRLTAIVYTDHRNLESFMTTKQLTRLQAQWAETMGCFDFEIIFRPVRQLCKPDALSRQANLEPSKEEKLTFGRLLQPENITPKTFAEVAAVDIKEWFVDKSIKLEDADHWFQVDVMGIEEAAPVKDEDVWMDLEINQRIRELLKDDPRIARLIPEALATPTDKPAKFTWQDNILYNSGRIKVPNDPELRRQIVRSRHDSRLAGHMGRAKTLSLVRRCYTWTGAKKFINKYVDGCDSCQWVKSSTLKPFGRLEPLPIPAGPWTDISYDMITTLPTSNGYDSILTVVDRLTKMAHFLPCTKSLNTEDLADLMLRQVWKLHSTPKTIVSDRGSVFVS